MSVTINVNPALLVCHCGAIALDAERMFVFSDDDGECVTSRMCERCATEEDPGFDHSDLDRLTVAAAYAAGQGVEDLLLWSQDGIAAEDAPTYCAMRCYGDLVRIARDKWRCADPLCAEVYGPR